MPRFSHDLAGSRFGIDGFKNVFGIGAKDFPDVMQLYFAHFNLEPGMNCESIAK